MTKISYIFLFSVLLFFSRISADLAITGIKGLYTSIKPEYEYWSPIHGVIAVKTNFLRNLFLMEMQEEERQKKEPLPVLEMLRQFFTINFEDKTLRLTESKTSLGRSLTPILLADLINYIMNTGDLKGKELIKKDDEFAQYLQTNGIKIKRVRTIRKAIEGCRQVIQGQQYALPYIGQTILMAWLVKKVDEKKEVAEFFDRLASLGNKMIADSYNKDNFLAKKYKRVPLDEVVEKYLTKKDIKKYKSYYEDFVFVGLNIFVGKLHQFPEYRHFVVHFPNINLEVADCTETALRIFLSELLSMGTEFNYHIFADKGIKLNSRIKKFYDKYHTFESVRKPQARQDWFVALSNINKFPIRYDITSNISEDSCAMSATVRNIMEGLRYLFDPSCYALLGITSIPKIITLEYVVNFFSGIVAAFSKANPNRIMILDDIKIGGLPMMDDIKNKVPKICNLDVEKLQKSEPTTLVFSLNESSIFTWKITGFRNPWSHTKVLARKQNSKDAQKICSQFVKVLPKEALHDYAALDLLSLFTLQAESIIALLEGKTDCISRMLLFKEVPTANIFSIVEKYYMPGTKQDEPFLLFALPSMKSVFMLGRVQQIEMISKINNFVDSKVFHEIIRAYIRPFVNFVIDGTYKKGTEEYDVAYLLFIEIIKKISKTYKKDLYDVAVKLLANEFVLGKMTWLSSGLETIKKYKNKECMQQALQACMPVLSKMTLTKDEKLERLVLFENMAKIFNVWPILQPQMDQLFSDVFTQ